ncbi:MAG: DUF4127 family protein [Selenomonadaceae bacterium]|nr:DUF4127 family protein [Selenomonadaceae bacterium]
MLKKFFLTLAAIFFVTAHAHAETILFVPHDNRPVSSQQPAEVVAQLGYEILMPPEEILTRPDELWKWLNENAPISDAAVVSSDALLYGGLIPSRSHEISRETLLSRVENFKTLREKNPSLHLYLFGSLMRTPSFGTPGDIEEPDYYGQYGGDIFQYTRLLDKRETSKLNRKEQVQLETYEKNLPADILSDWFARREKNLSATKKLLDFTHAGIIDYFIIGRDDNAPLSQTHRENLQLLAYMKQIGVDKTKAQSHAGIDEYAMLLLTRAVTDLSETLPFVNVQFNRGVGEKTIPDFSDEHIGDSIRDEIIIAGGMFVKNPERADFVLLVNTDPKGKTFEFHNSFPPQELTKRQQKYFRRNAKKFSALVEDAINKNLPVGVADIICANGADNFLMESLREKNLLFKLQSYGGWNTATNTSGFALGTGILAKKMSRESRDKLLARRFLDDWAYQANVRTQIAAELAKLPDGLAIYIHLGEHEAEITARENQLMQEFAAKNFPHRMNFILSNPWHRMFECRIDFRD